MNTPDDSTIGYIFEVDLEYPVELHDSHKDLPLFPKHFVSPVSKCKIPKFFTNVSPKTKYIVHYKI